MLWSQVQLKRRNYHVAVLEAETAFEVYVADLLLRLKVQQGQDRSQLLAEMENPGHLGLLSQRLRGLDEAATAYCGSSGLPPWVPFVGSPVYATWRSALYDLRNRIVHGGYRQTTFEEAKAAIVSGKTASMKGAGMPPLNVAEIVEEPYATPAISTGEGTPLFVRLAGIVAEPNSRLFEVPG